MRQYLFVMLALSAISLQAQFSVALQGGPHNSWVTPRIKATQTPAINPRVENYWGYHVGIAPAYRFYTSQVELALPIQWTSQKRPISTVGTIHAFTQRLQIVECNPRLGFFLSPDLILQAGVQVSYLLNVAHKRRNEPWQEPPGFIREVFFRSTATGITGSIRYSIHRLYLHGNIQYGLSSLRKFSYTNANGEPADEISFNHVGVQLGAGYWIAGKFQRKNQTPCMER